eukprot:8518832-Pyramimonas_sp.AAC.1
MIKRLLAPISCSKLWVKADEDAAEPKRKKPATKGKKGKDKDEQPELKLKDIISVQAEDPLGSRTRDGREKVFLDDIIYTVILGPLSELPTDAIDWNGCVSRGLRTGFKFMLTGAVTLNGKSLNKWSSLRREIRSEMVKGHLPVLSKAMKISESGPIMGADTMNPDQLADVIESRLFGSVQDEKMLDPSPPLPHYLDRFAADEKFTMSMASKI